MITSDLQEFFQDTCTWATLGPRDGYGNPTFINPFTYPCRLVRKNKLTRDKDAQQIVSTAQLWIGQSMVSGVPFPKVVQTDRITLSDGTTPQIASTEIFEDELYATEGLSHTVVFFI